MATLTQTYRPLEVTTPLGADRLLLVGFNGTEGLSQLYTFRLDTIAENQAEVPFDKLLGKPITVRLELPGRKQRHFSGICSQVSQGESDNDFTDYHLEVVPALWLLTLRARSRIFQHVTVPDILKEVLKEMAVLEGGLPVLYQFEGDFHPRDFCVQYRETDFNFASRLMEEEGIFYFFKHTDKGHQLVVANSPAAHPDLPTGSTIVYRNLTQGDALGEGVIYDWGKSQQLTTGKYTLWDHCFELPHKHLEAEKQISESSQVGQAAHKLKLGENSNLEVYDWPGEYAQRFDGVDAGGGERSGELKEIFKDNLRTVEIRMQERAAASIVVQGASNCRQLVSGHKFTLATLPDDALTRPQKAEGQYVLSGATHSARVGSDFRSGEWGGFEYFNTFTCLPLALPFRPPRVTPRPVVPGSQTAVVVGPEGAEVFTDKYGRVKVQFHWDREGRNDSDSSCWVRVAQAWAGKRWGASFWPRIGQEVVVDFLEGDPDQPIVVGSVYNADQMPPYQGEGPDARHHHDNHLTGVKSNSTPGGVGFNEIRFDDSKGREQVFLHAECDMDTRVKNDSRELVLHDRHLIVGAEKDGQKVGDQRELVYQDKHLSVQRNHVEHIEGNMVLLVGGADGGGDQDILILKDRKETIEGNRYQHIKENRLEKVDRSQALTVEGTRAELVKEDDHSTVKGVLREQVGVHSVAVGGDKREQIGGHHHYHVKGDRAEQVDGTQSLTVGKDQQEKVGGSHALEAGQEIHLKAGMKLIIEAGAQLSLVGPGGFIDIGPSGVAIQGTMVLINSGGAAGSGSGSRPATPEAPEKPQEPKEPPDAIRADPIMPTLADDAVTGHRSAGG